MTEDGFSYIKQSVSDVTGEYSGSIRDTNLSPTSILEREDVGKVVGDMLYDLLDGESRKVETDDGVYEVREDEAVAAVNLDENEYAIAGVKLTDDNIPQRPDITHLDLQVLSRDGFPDLQDENYARPNQFSDPRNTPLQEAWERYRDGDLRTRKLAYGEDENPDDPDFKVSSFRTFPGTVALYSPSRKLGRMFGKAENWIKKELE